jgi:cytochrome c556
MKSWFMGLTVVALGLGGVALAADDAPFSKEIKARQGIMVYRALNIGVLAGMAKGDVEYDGGAAQKAADNLVMSGAIDTSMLWPKGSDNSANPASTASPDAWSETSDVMAKNEAFVVAAKAMQEAASGGLDAVKAALDPLGGSCGGCHKTNRIPSN